MSIHQLIPLNASFCRNIVQGFAPLTSLPLPFSYFSRWSSDLDASLSFSIYWNWMHWRSLLATVVHVRIDNKRMNMRAGNREYKAVIIVSPVHANFIILPVARSLWRSTFNFAAKLVKHNSKAHLLRKLTFIVRTVHRNSLKNYAQEEWRRNRLTRRTIWAIELWDERRATFLLWISDQMAEVYISSLSIGRNNFNSLHEFISRTKNFFSFCMKNVLWCFAPERQRKFCVSRHSKREFLLMSSSEFP